MDEKTQIAASCWPNAKFDERILVSTICKLKIDDHLNCGTVNLFKKNTHKLETDLLEQQFKKQAQRWSRRLHIDNAIEKSVKRTYKKKTDAHNIFTWKFSR